MVGSLRDATLPTARSGQLHLSVRMVETHRSHIQRKLGASSRAQLVRYALDNDLIDR
jgi:DNA-binding CsgD family transcriptional regulator